MSRLNKRILSIMLAFMISAVLVGCAALDDSDRQTAPQQQAVTESDQLLKEIAYKSPITQPTEFISRVWSKYETMFSEQGYFDPDTFYYTNYYFDVIAWFRAQYPQPDFYGDSEYEIPPGLVKGGIDTDYGHVVAYLFDAPVPLINTDLASQIGQTVITKVNDIATNPAEYGIKIKKTSGYKAPDSFYLHDYSENNELLIYVERYAFNNIIAYSINFFVPTDDYYMMTGGGPWGVSCHQGYKFGMNFDAKTGKQITWEDIFADDTDYKSEIADYQEYRSFIDESPKARAFNYDKMFLLTPANILIGDDYNAVYCENKNMDCFDNRHFMEFDGSVNEIDDEYGYRYKGGDKLVDIKHSARDIPLKFFKNKIAVFERYETSDNLWDNSVETRSLNFPTNTLNGWLYSD